MINIKIIYKNRATEKTYEEIADQILIKTNTQYKVYSISNKDKMISKYLEKNTGFDTYIIEGDKSSTERIINNIKITKEQTTFIIVINTDKLNEKRLRKIMPFSLQIIEQEELKEIINTVVKIVDYNKDCITYMRDQVLHKIPYSDITYIEKERNKKTSIIRCMDNKVYEINKPLYELEKELGDCFIKTHKSAIVNKNNIKNIDLKNAIITFKNDAKCDLLSRNNKKKLQQKMTEKD